MSEPKPPNPGSDEAIKLGCTCPVLDNGHGRGAWTDDKGSELFWITSGCPLYDKPKDAQDGEKVDP